MKVICEPWKSPKDVLMRRPATYFATVLNWLASTNLPKTLNHLQHRVFLGTQVPYHAIKLIVKSWKKSQGRPNETSCNIFCNRFKVIGVYKSPKNIELYTIQGIICHPGALSRNKSDQWALKRCQGRPYETSCNIFCNRFKVDQRTVNTLVHLSLVHIGTFVMDWNSQWVVHLVGLVRACYRGSKAALLWVDNQHQTLKLVERLNHRKLNKTKVKILNNCYSCRKLMHWTGLHCFYGLGLQHITTQTVGGQDRI